MPRITFTGCGVTTTATLGETLLSCVRRVGLGIDSTCDGRGVCGKCRVVAVGELSPLDDQECSHLVAEPPDVRLACRASVQGNVSVTLGEAKTQLQVAGGSSHRKFSLNSPVRRVTLPNKIRDSRPYAERLPYRITDPEIFNEITRWDEHGGPILGLTLEDEVIDIRCDDSPVLGAALDIGTTSLAISLFNLENGLRVGESFALNPQTAYGGDVITRIDHCRHNPAGVSTLRSEVTGRLGLMLAEAAGPPHSLDQISLLTASGNTTMLHILAGVNPSPLARAPFAPAFLKTFVMAGDRSGMPLASSCRLMLLPGASAYVGSDIVAGLAAIDYKSCPRPTLFIDMGTNGEIVLIDGPDRLLGTSCAMGPALEGMNIACGCRAVPGAIDSVTLDENMLPRFTTIDALPAIGICGSGLVDLVACLLDSGIICAKGAFDAHASKSLGTRFNDNRYYLTDQVFLSQKDIRQIQLAKSAVASGIVTLLSQASRSILELNHIIIAGSFGYHLNAQNLRRIGLLPQEYRGPITFVGNSSLAGASLALLSNDILREMDHVASIIQIVELGSHPDFAKRFVAGLDFLSSEDFKIS